MCLHSQVREIMTDFLTFYVNPSPNKQINKKLIKMCMSVPLPGIFAELLVALATERQKS